MLKNDSGKYVLRVPGKATKNFIDRNEEYKNSLIAIDYRISPLEILYFDPSNGLQITRFLENAVFYSFDEFQKEEILQKAALALKKLHQSGMPFENTFDPFDQLQRILNCLKSKTRNIPPDLLKASQKMDELRKLFISPFFEFSPCHNDAIYCNFAFIDHEFQLLDWEYSGKNDPAWDLACFSVILSLTKEKELIFLQAYDPSRQDILQAKIDFFKPLIYLKASAWATLGLAEKFAKFTPAELKKISSQNFIGYEEAISSEGFKRALKIIAVKDEKTLSGFCNH